MKVKRDMPFQPSDVLGLVSRYRVLIFLTTAFFVGLSLAAASVLPKKYKARFVLTIDSQYFQSPLTREFVPELNERADVKAEASSRVRQALTPVFLDSLGEMTGIYRAAPPAFNLPGSVRTFIQEVKTSLRPYGLLESPPDAPFDLATARQALRERIEITDINDTTFQISFVHPDPQIAFQVTNQLTTHMVRTLVSQRSASLISIRDAIRTRVAYLAANVTASTEPVKAARSDLAREELADVRNQIRTMGTQYTDEHPVMQELRSRERTLAGMVNATRHQPQRRNQNPIFGGEANTDVREMYNDLLRKMNYLNIAIESDRGLPGNYVAVLQAPLFPAEPVGPRRSLIVLGGMALGLFTSLFLAATREYFTRSTLQADALAHQLGVPLLGKLPLVRWNEPKAVYRD